MWYSALENVLFTDTEFGSTQLKCKEMNERKKNKKVN